MKKRSGFSVMVSLIGLIKPLAGYMAAAITAGTAGHLCAAFITIFGGYAVLHILQLPAPLSLTALFVLVCVFAALRGILRYAEQSCNHYIAFKLLALIRGKVFRALRRLCPAKLEGKDKGNLVSVITADIELLEVFYAHTISPAVIGFLFSLLLCLFIGSFHWSLGVLALLAYLSVGVFIPLLISRRSGESGSQFRAKSGELSGFVLDSLRGLLETLQFGQSEKRLGQMNEKTAELSETERQMKKMSARNTAITHTVILLFDLAMLFLSAFLYKAGAVGFDGVLIPTIALMSSFGPVIALAGLGSTLQNTFAAGNRVLDILDESPVTEEISGKQDTAFAGAAAEQITFSYGADPILSDISAEIPAHSIVGVTGKSGSGKSTLLKLFMRFWSVQQGKVKISQTDIGEINTADLRNMESFMTQETHLFHDSIKKNLYVAKPDASDEEIIAACKKASIHDFILSLPKGYDTPVSELGASLSGGERQRLGLARMFLHNAPFLLLDEPTSNLDSLNEAVILKSLHDERKEKTILLVSHRKSTMRIADTVYSVESGRMS